MPVDDSNCSTVNTCVYCLIFTEPLGNGRNYKQETFEEDLVGWCQQQGHIIIIHAFITHARSVVILNQRLWQWEAC